MRRTISLSNTTLLRLGAGVVALLLLAGCHEPSADLPPDAVVLATVGDATITAEQFELAYAFGHAHLRRGATPAEARRAYLDLMLAEAALATEAERLRLDTLAAVRASLRTLEEELLIEHVFDRKVLSEVTVTDAEIRDALHRAAVSFQFRFLPAATEAEAERLRARWQAAGFDTVADSLAQDFGDFGIPGRDALTSPLVTASDLEPDVLAAIQDLERGTDAAPNPSAPVAFGGQWMVFEVVDIRRSGVADTDYAARRETFETVLYNEKALAAGERFVDATMAPLDVRTKRPAFEKLHAALWDWYRLAPPTRPLLPTLADPRFDAPFADALRDAFDTPLVTFDGQTWTVRAWLRAFTPGRYPMPTDRGEAFFKRRLADVVALVVRDHVLMARARAEGLDREPAYRQRLAEWRRSVLYRAYRDAVADSLDGAALRTAYARAEAARGDALRAYESLTGAERQRLRDRLATDRLRAAAAPRVSRAEVRTAVLDTLDLAHVEAYPTMTFTLVNANSNRPPFPVPDPRWRPVATAASQVDS